MTTNEIEKILEKYYEGLTSLEEERQLREYFSGEGIPPHLKMHAEQFRFMASAAREEIQTADFEERFFEKMNATPVLKISHRNRTIFLTSSIAASILLLFGLFYTFSTDFNKKPAATQPLSANEISYQQTQEILMLVSVSFNKGVDQMHHFDHFNQAVQKVQMISKFYQYETSIINPDPLEKRSTTLHKQ